MIKPNIQSINKNGFLKDNKDSEQKISTEQFIEEADKKIKNEFDILEESKNELRKFKY